MSKAIVKYNGDCKMWRVTEVSGTVFTKVGYFIEKRVISRLHRVNGPALIMDDGHEEWWLNGRLHRTDGPAITNALGRISWYVNDVKCETNASYKSAAGLNDHEMALIVMKYGNVSSG